MPLDLELRGRVERSLKELEEIAGSLHHVRRLADTQDRSVEELASVSKVMEGVSRQLAAVTASIGEAGGLLESAVTAVKQADPGATIQRVDAVARAVQNLGMRLDTGIELQENSAKQQEHLIGSVEQVSSRFSSSLEETGNSLHKELRGLRDEIAQTKSRVAIATGGAWLAALVALGVLALNLTGSLPN